MVTKMDKKLIPARLVPPGHILREELEAYGWTQKEFAEIIGKPVQAVNEIIVGKKSITPETAILFSEAFGTSAELWLNLESSYRLNIARMDSSDGRVARKAALYNAVPVIEMIKKGWIQAQQSVGDLENEVLRFLGIGKLNEIGAVAARLRVSNTHAPEQGALIAWLRRTEMLASNMHAEKFSETKLRGTAVEIKHLSRLPSQIEEVRRCLSESGVRFVVVPHLTKTYIDGAAFWLDPESPVVSLSMRYSRIDNFWFTLMHEIAHLLLHSDGGVNSFLDENLADIPRNEDSKNMCEDEANAQASEWLVPAQVFKQFSENCANRYTRNKVIAFAESLGVHPGIVVGRIHHDTGRYQLMRDCLVPVCDKSELEELNRAA